MTVNNIIIRNFEWADIEGLTGLTNELGYSTTIAQMKMRMEKIVQLDNYWTFVAELNKSIAGYIGINKHYFWEQDGHFIRIQALVVKQGYRRAGIGQKLVEAAENLARQTGSGFMLLNSGNREERQAAHEFYLQMGYNPKSTGYIKQLV